MGDVETDLGHAFDHRRGRRCAGHHAAHRLGDARTLRLGRVVDQAVHDGRGAVMVDTMLAHRAEDGGAIHAAQADMGAAQHRHRPRKAPAVAVEHRQCPEVLREMRHRPGGRVAHRVEVGAAVVRDHALRVTRGARGVAHRDGVPFVARALQPIQRRVCGQQRFVFMHAHPFARAGVLGIGHVDHHQLTAMLAAQQRECRAHHRGELTVGDQHARLAMVHLPSQQRCIEPGVQRVEHRVQGRHGVMRLDHLGRVRQHHADGAAAAHAQRLQCRSQAGRTVAHLRPVVAPRAMHHSGQVAEHLGAALDKTDRRQRDEIGGLAVQIPVVKVVHQVSRGGLFMHDKCAQKARESTVMIVAYDAPLFDCGRPNGRCRTCVRASTRCRCRTPTV